MKLTNGQRLICDRVINVFETGTIKGKYGAISLYDDGPHGIRQVTYGRSQTTEYGNLRQLVDMYASSAGIYSNDLKPYVKLIGNAPLVDNEPFKDLLKRAGKEDPVMWATQDKFFDKVYYLPAQDWATANGFKLPLSMLVIYDSFIHSGTVLDFLRSRFAERTPAKGGDEKTWIQQYVDVRNQWLSNHSKSILRASAYRTRDLLREIKRGNWSFGFLPIVANGTPVDDQGAEQKVSVAAIPKTAPDEPVPFLGALDGDQLASASHEQPAVPIVAVAPLNGSNGRANVLRALGDSVGVGPAVERLLAYRDRYRPTSNPRYWAVVNFDLHSAKPRLFVMDCVAGLVSSHLCAHGRGSEGPADDGFAEIFSNKDGSNCSSIGIYHCDLTYTGEHGTSLYLDGLESTNSNARGRHIVMHGASYVSPEVIHSSGRIGRSLGCPAIEMGDVARVIPKLMGGSLLVHWRS